MYYEAREKAMNNGRVYHLAAIADIVPSINNPLEYINNNFNGTINVLEAMKIHKVKRIIFAASASCYGMPKKIPTMEIAKIETHYPYSFSKYIHGNMLVCVETILYS